MISREQLHRAKPYLVFSAIILLFIVAILLAGRVQDFFRGEAFYEFHWTETEPFLEALIRHYEENGRFFSWVYTEGLYEVLGYQPKVFHLLAILLNFFSVVLAAVFVFRVWPKTFYKPWWVVLFGLLAFFFPYSTNWFVFFASDHYYQAILIFFLSVYLAQEWALRGLKPIYLVLSVVTFLVALFTYEHVAFVYPVALALAYPLIPAQRRTRRLTLSLAGLGAASMLVVLVPLVMYQRLQEKLAGEFVHPAFAYGFTVEQIPQRVIQSITALFGYLYNSGHSLATLQWAGPYTFVFFVGLAAWLGWRLWSKSTAVASDDLLRLRLLWGSALFLLVFGVFPYAAWGGLVIPHSRFYAVPLYGLVILLLLALALARRKVAQLALVAVSLAILAAGLYEYEYVSREYLEWEFRPTENYLSVVDIVPRVEPGTAFIFIDNHIGNNSWNGCALALRVLYDVQGLRCAHLSTTDPAYWAVRDAGGFTAYEGGRFNDENWILVGGAADGSHYIIDTLTPQHAVIMDWQSQEPLYTDFTRVHTEDGPPNSDMYFHLLKRWRSDID